ncbi:hypothetical protein CH371_15010 [Leptospira wolffii]|uniref:Uncharacterized protein n=1 Tax=Leptospira wolffii TaxID=409998 RepID=A0A2M9Z9Y9_9LEPT|nr:hypothetical protein CH371_15010 [Leptospira wolffii]
MFCKIAESAIAKLLFFFELSGGVAFDSFVHFSFGRNLLITRPSKLIKLDTKKCFIWKKIYFINVSNFGA